MSINDSDFLEQVIKYIKYDDIIKERQKKERDEINKLKELRKEQEIQILNHLNTTDNTFVTIANKGKLVKNVSIRKTPITKECMKLGIENGLRETKLITNEDNISCNKIVDTIIEIIDKKRPVKQTEYLRRVNLKNKPK